VLSGGEAVAADVAQCARVPFGCVGADGVIWEETLQGTVALVHRSVVVTVEEGRGGGTSRRLGILWITEQMFPKALRPVYPPRPTLTSMKQEAAWRWFNELGRGWD